VPEYGSPAVRRRRLAAELRRLRERAGLTGDEAALRLGWSASKISRIELYRTGIKPADLRALLDLYEVQDDQYRESLIALGQDSRRKRRPDTTPGDLPADYQSFQIAESEAASVWTWDPQIVPGLLQSPGYAREVLLAWRDILPVPPGEIDRRLESRLARQQILHRDPVFSLTSVIDESVLIRQLGGPEIMREQLNQLIALAEPANITIQVLPMAARQSVLTGAFIYLKFTQVHDVPLHDMAIVESLNGSDNVEDDESTYQYFRAFDALRVNSLPEEKSVRLIQKYVREKWS
jgi:transcriptional regulator with XRE-family HTH domain